jgi:hypothetical protein
MGFHEPEKVCNFICKFSTVELPDLKAQYHMILYYIFQISLRHSHFITLLPKGVTMCHDITPDFKGNPDTP